MASQAVQTTSYVQTVYNYYFDCSNFGWGWSYCAAYVKDEAARYYISPCMHVHTAPIPYSGLLMGRRQCTIQILGIILNLRAVPDFHKFLGRRHAQVKRCAPRTVCMTAMSAQFAIICFDSAVHKI